jgi:hypothetical protein
MATENLFQTISRTRSISFGLPLRCKAAPGNLDRAFYCDERHITPSLAAGDSSHLPENKQ